MAITLVVTAVAWASVDQRQGPPHDANAPVRIIVKLRDRSAAPTPFSTALRTTYRSLGGGEPTAVFAQPPTNLDAAKRYGLDRTYVIEFPAGTDGHAVTAALAAFAEDIEHVELDAVGSVAQFIPDDPDFDQQYAMHNTGATVGGTTGTADADIDAPEAWAIHTGDDGSVVIAIIDTGVIPHADFASRMVTGVNTVDGEDPTDTRDGCLHGTHVAGIAAAGGDNALGIAGVSWGAHIMPVRVFAGCSGSAADTAEGIVWAVDNGADICNISLQFCTGTDVLRDAVNYAHDNNVLVVSAAGNANIDCGARSFIIFPARYENSMAISATTNRDDLASFSKLGAELDVAAPGDRIWSTFARRFCENAGNNGSTCFVDAHCTSGGTCSGFDSTYTFLSGTSMATPCVSGLAALIKSFAKSMSLTLTGDELRTIIRDQADDLGEIGWDSSFGYGRVNAHSSLVALAPSCLPTPSPQPDVIVAKSRYLSFAAGAIGRTTAIRVTVVDLPPPHDALNGAQLWVGDPQTISENAGAVLPIPGFATFQSARLTCAPRFVDWRPVGVVHVHDAIIVPGGVYHVEAIDSFCDLGVTTDFSQPLVITTSGWGDVVGTFDEASGSWTAPNGSADITADVVAILDKFSGQPSAPLKSQVDLQPATPDRVIDILDVTVAIDAFRGFGYPFPPGPTPCND